MTFNCELGDAYLCREHAADLMKADRKPSWFDELFAPKAPRPRPYTAVSVDGTGVIVQGPVRSVLLAIKDAIRHGERTVMLMTDAGLVGLDTSVEWDLREVRRAER